jgi:hypothetical protein
MQGTDRKHVTPGTKAREGFAKLDDQHGTHFAPPSFTRAEIDELEGRGIDITGTLDRGEIDLEETRADKERIQGLDALVADFLAGDADGDEAFRALRRRQHAKVIQILSERLAETVGGLLICEPKDPQLRLIGAVVSQWAADRFGV